MTTPSFELLLSTMMSHDFGIVDILDMIAGLTNEQPQVGIAFTKHTADIFREFDESDGEEVTFATVIAEAYRRTFFNMETASKYGTEHLAGNTEAMDEMAKFLIGRFDRGIADESIGGAAMLMPSSDVSH